MRPLLPLGILFSAALTRPLPAQERQGILGEILRAEDHRALTVAELHLLLGGLSSRDTLVVERALRALGRLERPALAERMFGFLEHVLPGVRAEAAQAVAQAAQGIRADSSGAAPPPEWTRIVSALGRRALKERDPAVCGMVALSLGRLPYASPGEIRQARAWLLTLGECAREDRDAGVDVARGMETLVRLRARLGPLEEDFLARLRRLARQTGGDPRARRHALGALLSVQAADDTTLLGALAAPEPLTRRLAVTGLIRFSPVEARDRLTLSALADASAMVRLEALRTWDRIQGAAACPRLLDAAKDPAAGVALQALDLLGTSCGDDSAAARILMAEVNAPPKGAPWHRAAHALVSLSRLAPAYAAAALPAAAADPVWQVRMYAARAAGILRDTPELRYLAADSIPNVREAAIARLHEMTGHSDDAVYRAALGESDHQLVRSAALALEGSPARTEAAEALLGALERITRGRRETSRDPRIAILVRLRELGGASLSQRLIPYLRDYDPAIAESSAAALRAWTGGPWRAAPRRLRPVAPASAEIEDLRGRRLRFTLASGAAFEVALLVDDAPVTVLRVARLAARGYYDGLTFHRVVPNFVIQGGSPGANEYAGDGPYLRDELGPLSHERGTLGISTRGRDTGDAQLFVNLVDNPRLDYDYTVWGRVITGMDVVDAVQEGDVIRHVEIRPR